MQALMLNPFDWIIDFFVELWNMIPKIIYLLYSSLACLLDVFQLALRKLAGLDVYYDAQGNAVAGDIVTNFIAGILGIDFDGNGAKFDYSPLTTVFWAMVIFGVIMTFVSVFVAIIKSHYNYDEKAAKGPMQYVYAGLKSILNIVIVPIVVVLGLYVSQAVLTALDSITANPSSTISSLDAKNKLVGTRTKRGGAGNAQNDNEMTYIYYDLWGVGSKISYGIWSEPDPDFAWKANDLALTAATTQTFFGSLFISAAYNGNRARRGQIKLEDKTIFGLDDTVGIFANANSPEDLANMIDTAFACNVHLQPDLAKVEVQYEEPGAGDWTSDVATNIFFTHSIPAFSKFNIGAVWYYYDLWNFNFIVGFAAVIVCVSLFINIILGLMTRIFMCIGLFLIAPPLFGLAPIYENAAKGWRENFLKQVLMAYGSILGMNIFFLIFPLINQIKFFNVPIVDYFMTTLIIIVGLISIKAFISVVSGLVGGEDANKTGEGMKEEVGQTMGKAVKATVGAATLPIAGISRLDSLASRSNARREGRLAAEQGERAASAERANRAQNDLMSKAFNEEMDETSFRAAAAAAGMTNPAQVNAMWNAISSSDTLDEVQSSYASSGADASYALNFNTAQTARAAEQAHLKNQQTSLKNAKKTKDFAKKHGALSFMKDNVLGDKGLKGFTETIWKPRDFARETADNTAAMLGQMGEVNAGIGRVEQGVSGGNRAAQISGRRSRRQVAGVQRDMNQGFANTGADIRANTSATTAGFTAQLNETRGMRSDMNSGFSTVGSKIDMGTHVAQTGFSNVEGRIDDSIRTNRAGFANVGGKLDTANTHLDEIEQTTEKINQTADKIEQHTEVIEQKQKRIVQQNARATRRLKSVMNKADKIVKSTEKTAKEAKEINKKL